jgi:hypothetical protein
MNCGHEVSDKREAAASVDSPSSPIGSNSVVLGLKRFLGGVSQGGERTWLPLSIGTGGELM